jgi:hypothetical protein
MKGDALQCLLVHLSAEELRELDALLHEHLTILEVFGELELAGGRLVGNHHKPGLTIRRSLLNCLAPAKATIWDGGLRFP